MFCDGPVGRQKEVKISDQVNTTWLKEVKLPVWYSAYRDTFINMLTQFESMCEGYLRSIQAVKYWVERDRVDNWLIDSAPYKAGCEAKELQKEEKVWMLAIKATKHAQTKWTSSLLFILKPDGTFRFWADYCNLMHWRSGSKPDAIHGRVYQFSWWCNYIFDNRS